MTYFTKPFRMYSLFDAHSIAQAANESGTVLSAPSGTGRTGAVWKSVEHGIASLSGGNNTILKLPNIRLCFARLTVGTFQSVSSILTTTTSDCNNRGFINLISSIQKKTGVLK